MLSLSARRAWIEIGYVRRDARAAMVALRKESVDRNTLANAPFYTHRMSLSARRAWIEMHCFHKCDICQKMSLSARRAWIEIVRPLSIATNKWVALRKESVDRNNLVASYLMRQLCRSPQGERG